MKILRKYKLRQIIFVLQTLLDVNDIPQAISIATLKLIPTVIDILGLNNLAIRIDSVLEKEIIS